MNEHVERIRANHAALKPDVRKPWVKLDNLPYIHATTPQPTHTEAEVQEIITAIHMWQTNIRFFFNDVTEVIRRILGVEAPK